MEVLIQLFERTKQEGECRIWQKATTANGMPILNKKVWGERYARQLAYQSNGNTLEKNKTLRNTCLNCLCISPNHLTYTHTTETLYAEFMTQVNTAGGLSPDETKAYLGQCHIWTGCYNKARPALNRIKWGESIGARWIYKTVKGLDLPSNITVNHRCNNEKCVNPSHLYHAEDETINKSNIQQAITEKRIHNQKFTPEQVKIIRQRIASGDRTTDLCKEFKCSKPTIADIKYNRTFYDPMYEPPLLLFFA